MAATKNVITTITNMEGERYGYRNAKAATEYFEGAWVFIDSADGSAAKTTAAGVNRFGGRVVDYLNNTGALTTNTPLRVVLRETARVTLTGVTPQDAEKLVYMSDDNTFTLTSAGNTKVGYIMNYVAANTCDIYFEAHSA